MTLKNAILRGILGAPLGVFLGHTITIIISAISTIEGDYNPVVPQLAEVMGNEITAVVLQYFLCAILGFAFAAGSAVFEVEEWSITKQTIIHFIIITTAMFPIAYFSYWMRHTFWGVVSYITIFVVLYVIIWAIQIYFWKKRIEGINKRIQDK
jgi:hypothetical protein